MVTSPMGALTRSFFDRPASRVARDLLGCSIVSGKARARIVETEAYVGPQDLASHASKGRTRRTEVMFGAPGHAYVYLIYGMYWCLNAVTGRVGHPAAVLIRAAEPGVGCLGRADGPGRLCRALGITGEMNGIDLCEPGSPLTLEEGDAPVGRVLRGPRVNVDYAGAWAAKPLRFHPEGNPFVSRPRIGPRKG